MTLQVMRLLVAVGILLLTVVPSCRSESRVNSPFGSRMVPECRPGEYYTEPHDEYCERYYECNEGVATEVLCPIGRLYHCEREECFPVSPDTDISEICCAGLVTGSPLPETTPTIPTESTTTRTTTAISPTSVTALSVECPPTGDFILPNPEDCSQHIRCAGGRRTFMTCPGCTLFDFNDLKCTGYYSARCFEGSEIPECNSAVCSECILSSWHLLTVTLIQIISFVNTNLLFRS